MHKLILAYKEVHYFSSYFSFLEVFMKKLNITLYYDILCIKPIFYLFYNHYIGKSRAPPSYWTQTTVIYAVAYSKRKLVEP